MLKILNNKIQDWGLGLASFCYTVKYHLGKDNVAPDSFTRAFQVSMSISDLNDIHAALCHPGLYCMLHFVRTKNMPFSTEYVKKTCFMCQIYADLKPQFHRSLPGTLIKAMQSME